LPAAAAWISSRTFLDLLAVEPRGEVLRC